MSTEAHTQIQTKLYKRRWLMLLIFCIYSAINGYQWIQFATISDVLTEFYGVSNVMLDWMATIYTVVYVALILVVNWLLDKTGLLFLGVLASGFNAICSWLRVPSAHPDMFWLAFVAQCFSAMSNVCLLGLPPQLAATWFGKNELATATSIGALGPQFGVALGFLVTPLFVNEKDFTKVDTIAAQMRLMFYVIAIVSTLSFALVVLFYREKPDLPPSTAQAAVQYDDIRQPARTTLKELATSSQFVMLFVSFGLNVGVLFGITVALNSVITNYYPGNNKAVGQIGLIMVVSGIIGMLFFGILLDKTHKFKAILLGSYVMALIAMLAFSASIVLGNADHLWAIYLTIVFVGFSQTGYMPLGCCVAAEITYPISEGTTSGLLNAGGTAMGLVYTFALQALIDNVFVWKPVFSGLLLLIITLAVGTATTAFIHIELRRTRTETRGRVDSFFRSHRTSVVSGNIESSETTGTKKEI